MKLTSFQKTMVIVAIGLSVIAPLSDIVGLINLPAIYFVMISPFLIATAFFVLPSLKKIGREYRRTL